MARRLGSIHVTGLGWVVLLLIPASLAVFVFGPSGAQAPALIVAALLLLAVVGGGFSRRSGLTGVERAASEFPSKRRSEPIETEAYDPGAWQRERERREGDAR